jgi:hypothetical protein
MTRKTRYFLVGSAALLLLGVAGGLIAYLSYSQSGVSAGVPLEVRFIPANADLVAYADVQAVMTSDLRRELVPETGSGKGQQMMNDFAGIDLEKQVNHLLAFVEPSTEAPPDAGQRPEAPRALMLVQGSFEQPRIEQFIRERNGTIESYNGHSISVRREGQDEIAVGFVRPDLIAVGQGTLVRRVLDLSSDTSGRTPDVTGNEELMNLIRDASGSTAWVVGYFDALRRGMKLPSAIGRQVPPLRLVLAKANVNGGIQATIRAETADQAAADQLRDVVRGFVSLARLQAGARPELEDMLKSIELSGTDTTVQMSFAVAPETLRAIAPRRPQNREP